ncbi:peptidoglycan-binding protein [Sorangium sp. So ce887]|uniref:peptidoglycan-binding protein n=1 Tax=Sorangium sp. So ce887 TaxID=3133324 RepID=UPI003F62386E
MKAHRVRAGDCFTSIAYENGFFWQTLWDHPENQVLREVRSDPFTLVPGVDKVVVPDPRLKEESCQTTKLHTFRRRGVPAKLRIRLLDHEGRPRANEGYFLEVDGELRPNDKKADGDGRIEEFIPNNARQARLFLSGGEEIVTIALGYLQPSDEIRGIQSRLANLGFYHGEVDGQRSPAFADALARFRAAHDLDASLPDDDTFQEIKRRHEE